jgi:hypothetical protein
MTLKLQEAISHQEMRRLRAFLYDLKSFARTSMASLKSAPAPNFSQPVAALLSAFFSL